MWRFVYACAASGLIIFCCGFGCFSQPTTSFTITVEDAISSGGANPPPAGTASVGRIPRPGTPVSGEMVANSQGSGAQGSLAGYEGVTDFHGWYTASNVIVPAQWNHYVMLGYPAIPDDAEPCLFPSVPPANGNNNVTLFGNGLYGTTHPVAMTNGSSYPWTCYYDSSQLPRGFARFALQGSLPSALTITSNSTPLSTTNGYPSLYVYGEDSNGNPLFNAMTATNVSSNGSSATFPFPSNANGSALAPGLYSAALVNNNPDGSISPAGPNILSIGGTQSFNTPFGVAAQVVQSSWYSSDTPDIYNDRTCAGQTTYNSGSSTQAYPIVTQYSQGNVSVNGSYLIPVGVNPAAIALYNPIDQQTFDNSNGPCSYSGSDTTMMGNGIVANSGSNTVSILNLSVGVVTATVTVGQNPSALALSSDQTVAYVVNSGDGTLSRVDLGSYVQTGTVNVGPVPQAVEVAPDGTVWVGGQGSLTPELCIA